MKIVAPNLVERPVQVRRKKKPPAATTPAASCFLPSA
jgi:hypothetical protein